jgi:predicted cytidylate kinase
MIISFSGAPGSGKSVIAQKLAKKLKWPHYYIGGLRREAAKKMGLTLAEYNKLGETDHKTDTEVDKYQKELGKKQDNFIIEGRTSWYFIPRSLKIYLDVDRTAAAKRIFADLKKKDNKRNEGKNFKNWQEVLKIEQNRMKSDKKRYKKYYNINVYNKKNYDFCLDTTELSINQVLTAVYKYVKTVIDKG